jgi:alginate O-acetyltransferase complex protein AlgJ
MNSMKRPSFQQPSSVQSHKHIAARGKSIRWLLAFLAPLGLTALAQPLFTEGKDGFFFAGLEDLDWLERSPKSSGERIASNLELIASINKILGKRNIKMVFALVPMVERIYENKLPATFPLPASSRTLYQKALPVLKTKGVIAPDLNTPLLELAKRGDPQFPLFMRQDNHWSTLGAFESSKIVAENIRTTFPSILATLPEVKYELTWGKPQPFNGNYFKNFSEADRNRVGQELFKPIDFSTKGVTGSGDALLKAHDIGITVVGTSFTENPSFQFSNAIGFHLNRETINVAYSGAGPWTPMLRYLSSDTFQNAPPKILVWEFPESFLARAMSPVDNSTPAEHNAFITQLAANLTGDCGKSGIMASQITAEELSVESGAISSSGPTSDATAKLVFKAPLRADQFLSLQISARASTSMVFQGMNGKTSNIEIPSTTQYGQSRLNLPLHLFADNKSNSLMIRASSNDAINLENLKICQMASELIPQLQKTPAK